MCLVGHIGQQCCVVDGSTDDEYHALRIASGSRELYTMYLTDEQGSVGSGR